MAHYVHDEKNNRIEALSKEEIYALLAEAIQEGQLPSVDADTAFVTMIKSIVDGNAYKIGFCTQAQYNQLEAQGLLEANAYYILIDDPTYDEIVALINGLTALVNDYTTNVNATMTRKLEKDSIGDQIEIYITNENGILIIKTVDGTLSNPDYTMELIFNQANIQLVYKEYSGGVVTYTKTYALKTYLDKVDTLEERVDTLENTHKYLHIITARDNAWAFSFQIISSDDTPVTDIFSLITLIKNTGIEDDTSTYKTWTIKALASGNFDGHNNIISLTATATDDPILITYVPTLFRMSNNAYTTVGMPLQNYEDFVVEI